MVQGGRVYVVSAAAGAAIGPIPKCDAVWQEYEKKAEAAYAAAAQFDAKGRLIAWGDPAQGFVGDPDGRIERLTGYGVYFGPVAAATTKAGAQAIKAGGGLYGSPIAPSEVYDAVLDGHPVVAWISNTYRTAPLSRYTAFDGATVSYTLTEHAVTVIGVRPDAVLINDPWFGRHWHAKAQFEAAYATFQQMAVIVGS